MIHASQIEKNIGDQSLFSKVSFFLPAGSYTYLTGASGSGKTTLLEMIAGKQRPDSGSLTVNGNDMCSLTPDRLPYFRRSVGIVETFPVLMENRSAAGNILMPLEIAGFEKRTARERLDKILDELGLTTIADVPVQRLTADQRWLTACGRATIRNPALVLMDQPPAEISTAAKNRQEHLTHLQNAMGATVLLATTSPGSRQTAHHIEIIDGRVLTHEFSKAVY